MPDIKKKTISDKDYYISQSRLKPLVGKKDDPFTPVKDGYGYYGTILHDEVDDKIQCHVCGETYRSLSGHIGKVHKLTAREYKDKYELNYGTRLITPSLGERASKQAELQYKLRMGLLNSREIDKIVERKKAMHQAASRGRLKYARKKRHNGKFRYTIETMNKFSTCPAQLEERFIKAVEDFGRSPSYEELRQYSKDKSLLSALERRFKGYANALYNFGFEPKKGYGGTRKYGIEEILKQLHAFIDEFKRLPNARDTKVGLLPDYVTLVKYLGSWQEVKSICFEYLSKNYPKHSSVYGKDFFRTKV